MASAVPSAITVFWGSRRRSTRLVSCEDRNTEMGMGRKASPVARGEYPWTSWRNWAMK